MIFFDAELSNEIVLPVVDVSEIKQMEETGNINKIVFDKATTIQVNDALLNPYGFDLNDLNQIGFTFRKLRFTLFGFKPTNHYETLIATIKVTHSPHERDEYTYIQRIDLYNIDKLDSFCRAATQQLQLGTINEIKNAVHTLRERLERYRLDEVKNLAGVKPKINLTSIEQQEALNYLKSDNILDVVEGLLEQAGIVTEKEKALQVFFTLLSRHFEKPLHILLQGSTQLSKMLLDVIVPCIPEEQIHAYTSMSASSLYYTKHKSMWKNSVLYLSNIDNHFKGAGTIKEFIENGILKRYTTETDYQTGQLYASNKIVEGGISMIAYCNDENMYQRFFEECFAIRLDENPINQQALLEFYKMECAGLVDKSNQQEAIIKLKNIQRCIKPIRVVVPFAMKLDLPKNLQGQLKTLPQLLTFIKSVALLHQYLLRKKRDEQGEYIEATLEHLQIALDLFKGHVITQGDNLSLKQRNLLEWLKNHVESQDKTFTIPQVLKSRKMSSSDFYREFTALKERGYVLHAGGNKKKGIQYSISDWSDKTEWENSVKVWIEKLKAMEVSQVSQKFPKDYGKLKHQ